MKTKKYIKQKKHISGRCTSENNSSHHKFGNGPDDQCPLDVLYTHDKNHDMYKFFSKEVCHFFQIILCMNNISLHCNLASTFSQDCCLCISLTLAHKEQCRTHLAALFCTICNFYRCFSVALGQMTQIIRAILQVQQNKWLNKTSLNRRWMMCRAFSRNSDTFSHLGYNLVSGIDILFWYCSVLICSF